MQEDVKISSLGLKPGMGDGEDIYVCIRNNATRNDDGQISVEILKVKICINFRLYYFLLNYMPYR